MKTPSHKSSLKGALLVLVTLFATGARSEKSPKPQNDLAAKIAKDGNLAKVHGLAFDLLKGGLNAGNGYNEVWIRDLNTFIEVALEANPRERMRSALLTFFKLQGEGGDIVDGYVPKGSANVPYAYRTSPLAPDLVAHKNTVETDQESSLVQAVSKYVHATGDRTLLDETVAGVRVSDRLGLALSYVLQERFDPKYGLVWGATRADWGDIQPESEWGIVVDDKSHRALCIYDNAMFLIAVDDYLELLGPRSLARSRWKSVRDGLRRSVRKTLWDAKRQKFIPHVYLAGSPFPKDFDENAIYYHGGTAVAIEAGLLSRKEVLASLKRMEADATAAGASSIGLTMYPPYPEHFFANSGMAPYNYQNGGDWCWFGGRMIHELIRLGYVEEAYRDLRPMLTRVVAAGGFHEWWSRKNEPQGSDAFRGSAGVLGRDIELLQDWAKHHS